MPKEKVTIDDLAVMINKGFGSVENRLGTMENDIKEIRRGQEEIELKLCNVAYRFELKQLEERFEDRLKILERKSGIRSQAGSDEISYDRI